MTLERHPVEIRDTAAAEVHRWLLVLALGASALVYGPAGGLEGGGASKTTVVLLAGLAAAVVAAAAAVRSLSVTVPWHPATAVALAFAVAMLGRALVSDAPVVAMLGPVGRANGAALYLACVALFLVAAGRSDARTWTFLTNGLVVVGAVVALAAIDEATIGIGPNWAQRPGVAGTLGNANFLAGWAGIVLPLPLVVVLDARRPRPWRITAGIVAVLLVVAAALSGSLQAGYVTISVVVVLGLVWSFDRLPRQRWRPLAGSVLAVGLVGALLTVLGAVGTGPLAVLRGSIGVRLRAEYWAAGARMWREAPLTGVGPGQFIDRYRQVRSPDAATLVDLSSSTDSAHNVPLHLAAEGGIVIGLLYVAVLVTVALALGTALRRTTGADRLVIGGFGAAWVGYVLQSLISIDVAPLAVLGWVLAGVVVGAAAPAVRRGRVDEAPRAVPTPVLAGQGVAALALVGVTFVGVWAATLPYRADAASARAVVENKRTPEGRTATSTAVEVAPWRDAYRLQLVRALNEDGDTRRAAGVAREALEVNPDSFEATLNAARLAFASGDIEAALRRYARARDLEPHHPDLAVEFAKVVHDTGDEDRARTLLEQALQVDPDHEEAQLLLGDL